MRVVLKYEGFEQLRTDPKIMAELNRLAEETAAHAGDGFEARPAATTGGRVRGRAAVVTATAKAMRRNAKHNTLLKALGGGAQAGEE